MTFEKELDPSRRLVIRLWPTSYRVGEASGLSVALWVGMVTLERLEHPAGLATMAMTDQEFGMATAKLATSLQSQGVRFDIKRRDKTNVLLVPSVDGQLLQHVN